MRKLSVKEVVYKFMTSTDSEKSARIISNFVNSFNYESDEFIKELKKYEDTSKFTAISLMWVNRLSTLKSSKKYDARNEYSVDTSCEIIDIISKEMYKEIISMDELSRDMDYKLKFVNIMSSDHRTLQQSFSSLVFMWLKELENVSSGGILESIGRLINKKMISGFEKTPLI